MMAPCPKLLSSAAAAQPAGEGALPMHLRHPALNSMVRQVAGLGATTNNHREGLQGGQGR